MVSNKNCDDFPRSDGADKSLRRSDRNVVKRQSEQLFKSKFFSSFKDFSSFIFIFFCYLEASFKTNSKTSDIQKKKKVRKDKNKRENEEKNKTIKKRKREKKA